jgi:hypothetical protein
MKRIKTESIYETKTPKEDIERPIYKAFQKVRTITSPLLSNELLRKRRRVKRIND